MSTETAPQDRAKETFEKLQAGLRQAGRTLWLAGLGLVAEVAEADRKSRELFDELVEKGRPVAARQKTEAERFGRKANDTAKDFGKLIGDTVEYETKRALKKAGMITRDDVKVLTARLETLSKKVDEYAARQA